MNPFATNKNKYLDNYASSLPAGASQSLTTPTYAQGNQALTRVPPKKPQTELERLIVEREELVGTGCYTDEDPLIQEMDR